MDTPGLLQYLPAIYHEDECLGPFLRAFETILLGDAVDEAVLFKVHRLEAPYKPEQIKGLEKHIAALPYYFDPNRAPEGFLPWLAGWTGFALRADLPPEKRRDFIANAISLYRMRGTKANMLRLLEIFTSTEVTLTDDLPGKLFCFKVGIRLDKDYSARQQAIAHALIEREKPAHTSFQLLIYLPKMKIGKKGLCEVGKTTFLSAAEEDSDG